jgi:hypothetical protein
MSPGYQFYEGLPGWEAVEALLLQGFPPQQATLESTLVSIDQSGDAPISSACNKKKSMGKVPEDLKRQNSASCRYRIC